MSQLLALGFSELGLFTLEELNFRREWLRPVWAAKVT